MVWMNPMSSPKQSERRAFLKYAGKASLAAFFASCSPDAREAFLSRHYKELKGDELDNTLRRLEEQYLEKYGTALTVEATPPQENVLFGYALDLSRCIGCRKCVYACVEENNLSREFQVHYIQVLQMSKIRGVDLAESDMYYEPEEVPEEGYFYMPIACQQCENSPCTAVCPVGATWKEPDGVVVVDYDWCIGCRYCMASCPYNARKFNWTEPEIPKESLNPKTHYLGNRPRYRGVVEKCTFCIQRVRKGRYPACVEICPVGARKFGNLLDPKSEVRSVIRRKRVFILKEDLNTQPKFFYFYGS